MILTGWIPIIIAILTCSSVHIRASDQGCNPCNSQYNYEYDYAPPQPPYTYFHNVMPIPILTAPASSENNSVTPISTAPQATPLPSNYLYLLLDPKTQRLSVQVTPSQNQINNTVTHPSKPSNLTSPPTGTGTSDSGTGVCSTIALIKNIIDGLANILKKILLALLDAVIKLVNSILGGLVTPLLDKLTKELENLLNSTLTTLIKGVESAANATLNSLLNSDSLVTQLLGEVDQILQAQPGAELVNLTENVNKLLNDTLLGVLNDVETAVNDLFNATTPPAIIPSLTQNITLLVNATLQALLYDVNATVTNLLEKTLGNDSLITDVTNQTEILLTDALNDTICNLQKIFNETDSILKIVANVQKLATDLVTHLTKDLTALLTNILDDLLSDSGILKKLLEDINKLLTDVLLALFRHRTSNVPMKKPDFKKQIVDTISSRLTNLITTPPPILAPSLPENGQPSLNNTPTQPPPTNITTPQVIINDILKLVGSFLDTVLGTVDDLVKQLTDGSLLKDPVSNSIKDVEKLLDGLLKALLNDTKTSTSDKLSNSSSLLDLPSLTSPIGTLVTDVLKTIFQCNVSCTPTNNVTTPTNNDTSPTPEPPTIPTKPEPCYCNPPCAYQPYYCRPPYTYPPCCKCPPFANPDCSATADQFQSQLQQYESTIAQEFYKNLYPAYSAEGLADSMIQGNLFQSQLSGQSLDEYDESAQPTFPDSLLQGVYKTIQFTRNAVTNGLPTLVNSVAANSNSTESLTLPIL